MTVAELIEKLQQLPQDLPVDALAHDGYLSGNGTWFDAPIVEVEVNDDVWPLRVRLVVES
ncbi:MAG TPA: hypothetical protein PLB92_03815 [Rhodoglobus sp.]|nr:hypothetical protein [Rhodoglobus sp.]